MPLVGDLVESCNGVALKVIYRTHKTVNEWDEENRRVVKPIVELYLGRIA
jgi:hypothetical protein